MRPNWIQLRNLRAITLLAVFAAAILLIAWTSGMVGWSATARGWIGLGQVAAAAADDNVAGISRDEQANKDAPIDLSRGDHRLHAG